MVRKNNPNSLKVIFTFAQIIVLAVVVAIVLWVTAINHKDDVLTIFSSKLDHAVETMASQLKSNQVPTSGGPEGHGVFIINQNDGAVIVDKHLGGDVQEEEWQRYRTKLIYEMQKQKRGWIVYPEKTAWQVNQAQRVIRYISIDELGWIFAVEAQRPTDLQLLKGTFKKNTYIFVLCLVLFAAVMIWLINERYFYLIWRSITDTVENNFMSLSGEDSIWDKFKNGTRPSEDLEKEALGLGSTQQRIAPTNTENILSVSIPVIETLQPPTPQEEFRPVEASTFETENQQGQVVESKEETTKSKENIQEEKAEAKQENQLTLNVNEIKSQALKKIIKKFREK